MNNHEINLSFILSDTFKKTLHNAEHGSADEQFHLGIMYIMGHGTDRDFIKAGIWFDKAKRQGNSLAKTALDYLNNFNPPK